MTLISQEVWDEEVEKRSGPIVEGFECFWFMLSIGNGRKIWIPYPSFYPNHPFNKLAEAFGYPVKKVRVKLLERLAEKYRWTPEKVEQEALALSGKLLHHSMLKADGSQPRVVTTLGLDGVE